MGNSGMGNGGGSPGMGTGGGNLADAGAGAPARRRPAG